MDKGRKKKKQYNYRNNSHQHLPGVLKLINLDVKQRSIPITLSSVTILKTQVFIKAAGGSWLIFNLYNIIYVNHFYIAFFDLLDKFSHLN